jgi:hypothetical protein
MARYHGVTSDTPDRFVIDSGKIFVGVDETKTTVAELIAEALPIGATRGGSTFTVEQEIREMPVDGAKGPVKGCDRITKVNAKMTLNMVEWSTYLIRMALPGAVKDDYGSTHDDITRALQIAAKDYKDNIALVGEVSGSADPIVCIIRDALAAGNFELGMADNEEAVCKLEVKAHFDPSDLDTEPWRVLFPQDVELTTEGA